MRLRPTVVGLYFYIFYYLAMEKKLYKIYDIQCQRYKWDWTIYKSIREMVEELADYHNIDWNEEAEEWFENETMLQRYDRKFDNDQARLDDLCAYWEWEVQELSKKDLIDEIITMDWYDIQNQENPQEQERKYIEQLEQLDVDTLQKYIDDEITSEELYDEFISKL